MDTSRKRKRTVIYGSELHNELLGDDNLSVYARGGEVTDEEYEEEERPCVEMFDPALRVLGRGSFGRVSVLYRLYKLVFVCLFQKGGRKSLFYLA